MTEAEEKHFDNMSIYRDRSSLKRGQRWLICDDYWQLGDEYDGGSGWWEIGGQHTSVSPGEKVPIGMLCYTPRGVR